MGGFNNMNAKVTMQDIADHVGMSKFAVSKALSGKGGVKPETRDRIVQAAIQLGYKFPARDAAAADVIQAPVYEGKSVNINKQVIILVPNVRFQTRQSYYWGRIIEGAQEELDERGIGSMLVTEQITSQFSTMINPRGVMGLIGVGLISYPSLLEIRNLGIPMVLIDHEEPLIPTDVLSMNNFEWMRRIVHYVIGLGHRNLQFVGNLSYSRSFYDRWFGFRSMLEEHGLDASGQHDGLLTVRGHNRSEMTEALEPMLQELAREGRMPTAFSCANDSIAMCVMTLLARMGISVPGDVSVTGFDDIQDAALSSPTLTTVHVHKHGMGRRAVEALLRRAEQPANPVEKVLLTGELVIRRSTAASSRL